MGSAVFVQVSRQLRNRRKFDNIRFIRYCTGKIPPEQVLLPK